MRLKLKYALPLVQTLVAVALLVWTEALGTGSDAYCRHARPPSFFHPSDCYQCSFGDSPECCFSALPRLVG